MIDYHDNWYTLSEIESLTGLSRPTLYRQLANIPDNLRRTAPPDGAGRPQALYHYMAHPRLQALHISGARHLQPAQPAFGAAVTRSPSIGTRTREASRLRAPVPPCETLSAPSPQSRISNLQSPAPSPKSKIPNPQSPPPPPIAPDDLALASLRYQAVLEVRARYRTMSKERALDLTADAWRLHPRKDTIEITDRLPSGHTRTRTVHVQCGPFKPRALRAWEYDTRDLSPEKALVVLAPQRKGRVGRKSVEIPANLIQSVWIQSASTDRADVTKAVALVKSQWPGEFPDVHISTWQRRIRAIDKRKAAKDLTHSRARYRQLQGASIEIDWTQLPYNGQWQIDDAQSDWYSYNDDLSAVIRPYAYKIIRTRTRQWVALVSSTEPVVGEQVQSLLALAFASAGGGIPDAIKFERGAVACTPEFEARLNDLGIRVERTGMDGGAPHPDVIPDSPTGHFMGKGVVESNIGADHGITWNLATQTGPDERNTGPARLEVIIRMADHLAKARASHPSPSVPSAVNSSSPPLSRLSRVSRSSQSPSSESRIPNPESPSQETTALFRSFARLVAADARAIRQDKSRITAIRDLARELAARNIPLIIPGPDEVHRIHLAVCERHNNKPHTGLPLCIDPDTGDQRHMTPNEMARALADQPIRIMPADYVAMLGLKGRIVRPTRNGITLNTHSYGRFDDELCSLPECTVLADPVDPDFLFVYELGRCIERYTPAAPGDYSQIERQRHRDKQFGARYREALDRVLSQPGNALSLIARVAITDNPTPSRPAVEHRVPDLDARASSIAQGFERARAERKRAADNFRPLGSRSGPAQESPSSPPEPRRNSLLSAARKIDAHLVTASPPHSPDHNPEQEQ